MVLLSDQTEINSSQALVSSEALVGEVRKKIKSAYLARLKELVSRCGDVRSAIFEAAFCVEARHLSVGRRSSDVATSVPSSMSSRRWSFAGSTTVPQRPTLLANVSIIWQNSRKSEYQAIQFAARSHLHTPSLDVDRNRCAALSVFLVASEQGADFTDGRRRAQSSQ